MGVYELRWYSWLELSSMEADMTGNPNEPDELNEWDEDTPTEVREMKRETGAWAKGLFEKVLENKDKDDDQVRKILSNQVRDLQDRLEGQANAHREEIKVKDKRIMMLVAAMLTGWGSFALVAIVLFAYLAGFRGTVDADLKSGKVGIGATGSPQAE